MLTNPEYREFTALSPVFVPARLLAVIAPVKILAPSNVCVPVVTTPRAVAEASGRLNVWAVPVLTIPKSVPVVPTAKVWVPPVSPFSEVSAANAGSCHVPSSLRNLVPSGVPVTLSLEIAIEPASMALVTTEFAIVVTNDPVPDPVTLPVSVMV